MSDIRVNDGPTSERLPAILMIALGAIAFFLPTVAGVGTTVLLGYTVLVAGSLYGVSAFAVRGTAAFVWRLLSSVAFVSLGFSGVPDLLCRLMS